MVQCRLFVVPGIFKKKRVRNYINKPSAKYKKMSQKNPFARRIPIFAVLCAFILGALTNQAIAAVPENGHPPSEIRCDTSLCISGTGGIGVGTTSPLQKLHVDGNLLMENNKQFIFKDASGIERPVLKLNANNEVVFANTGKNGEDIIFNTDTSTKMVITNNGNIGIGTAAPGAKLHVKGGDFLVSGNTRDDAKCQWANDNAMCASGKYAAAINCHGIVGGTCKLYCCDL